MIVSNNLIIKTKLFPPASRSGVILRPGLNRVLEDTVASKKLALVHAPAGYGKTTLMYQWYEAMLAKSRATCWLSLDELDDDSTTFVRYILFALQEVVPDFWQDFANWIEGRLQPDITISLNHIINELVRIDTPLTLFIDDYHHVHSGKIHQFVERLIDWSPPGFLLVIGSRIVPSISLSKWRVSEEMTEIDVSMLRFSREEATAFLKDKHELQLTEEQTAIITEKSEGWAAGLQLVALVLKSHHQRDEFIASFSGNLYEIADYLTHNVLSQQSAELTEFLLKTSILSRFNAELCTLMTGRADSQNMLAHLEKEGLFTLPLDRHEHWYRYHHLFRDVLISRLRRQYPHEVLSLYRTAARWFRNQGLIKEAVDYALLSSDFEMIEDIHRDAVAITSLMGTTAQVYTWLSNVPDTVKNRYPRFLILEGFALCLMNRIDAAEYINGRIKQALTELSAEPGSLTPEELSSLGVEAIIVPASIAAMKDDNTQLLELTERIDGQPVDNLMVATLNDLRGWAEYRRGQFEESKELLASAWLYFSINKQSYGMAVVDGYSGIVDMQQLDYQAAYKLFERSENAAMQADSGNIFARGLASTMRATVCYEWNRVEEAKQLLDANLHLIEEIGPPVFSCHGYVTLSRCYAAGGDWDAADNALNRALFRSKQCVSKLFPVWIERERLILARKMLDHGVNATFATENPDEPVDDLPAFWELGHYFEHANAVRRNILFNNAGNALHHAKGLRAYAEEHRASQLLLDCLLLEAQILKLLDQPEQAVCCMQRVIKLARPARLLRTLVDEGDVVRQLFEGMLSGSPVGSQARVYMEEISNSFVHDGASNSAIDRSAADLTERRESVESLSKRELEVLQLISTGKTNNEIAEHLFIANATVKFHVSNILSKLNVTNRTLAVATARSSGLVR